MSGTSMAAAAAAGAAACVMGTSPSSACRCVCVRARMQCTQLSLLIPLTISPFTHTNHSSSDAFTGKLRNPRVSVAQPSGGSKPLSYLASGSTVRCP